MVLEAGRLIVLVQVAPQGKRLVASFAVVILESRVGLHVSSQVGSVCEGLSTVGTAVGLGSCVTSHVALQQPRPGESLSTDIAPVVEVVCQHMHAECRHAHVHLVTDVALLGVCRVEGAVGLPVSRQVARGGVVLATFGASELGLFFR